jgi:acyl-CoA thioester hydrolase
MPHRCDYRVIYGDTDQMGVMYYANHLRLFERGRTELMADRAFDYSLVEAEGIYLPVVEANVKYRVPARFNDIVTIETVVQETTRITLRFAYRLLRGEVLLAEGSTLHAAIDKAGRPTRLPASVVQLTG